MLHSVIVEQAGYIAHQPGEGFLRRTFRLVVLAFRIRRERAQLAELSDEQLADIGIERQAADAEAGRNITDIPIYRRSGLYL